MVKINRNLLLGLTLLLLGLVSSGCTKELRKARHLSRGDRAFKAGKYDEAEIEYLKVLQAVPLQPVAVRQLGIIYQEEGKLLHAHQFLTKAVEFEPANPEVRLKLALNYLSLGDMSNAVLNARLVLAKQPGQSEAVELLAASAVSSAGLLSAQQEIEKLRRGDQDRASYHIAFGTIDLRRQDLTNAETEFKKALQLDPKSSPALVGLGNIYWAQKNAGAAEQAFKSAAQFSPPRSLARLKYPQFELVSGKTDLAKQMVQQITTEIPDYLPAWNFLAQIAYNEKKYDDCYSVLQRVLSRDPYNLDALLLEGNLRLTQGDAAKAIKTFTQATSVYNRSPQLQFLLARALLMTNDSARATVCLNQALKLAPDYSDAVLLLAELNLSRGNPSASISSLDAFLKRQPKVAQAYLLLARAYLAKDDSAQALGVCRRMTEVFPKSAEAQFALGSLLVRERQNNDARQAFEQAVALSPDYLPASEQLVNLDLIEKQYGAATRRVQALIDRKPSAAEPWLLMSKIHLAQAQALVDAQNRSGPAGTKLTLADPAAQPEVSQAEAALLKAIDLNPGLRSAYLMLAEVYISAGKQQQALDRLNSLLAKTNDVAVLMQVGMIQDSMKNYPAARESYEKVLAADPNFGPALNNLAYLYSEPLGDLDKAYTLAERARQLHPGDPATADTLGWILYKRGDYARALGLLQESVNRLPDDPEIQLHFGMSQYMLDNENSARVSLQKAAQSTKQFRDKDLAVRCLALLDIDPKTADAKAVALLEKRLQDAPRDPVALDRLGAIQERDGNFDKAAETYQTALKYGPHDSVVMFKLAQLYASPRLHDPQKALSLAKAAHDISPDNAHISALLGQLVYTTGAYKWSASLLEDSARKLPDDPQITFDLAWAYYGIGRVSEASELMQKVAGLGARFAKSDEAKRFVTAVAASADATQAAAFAGEAQRILGSEADYIPALVVMALSQEGQGNYTQAADTYNRILAKDPFFSPATRNLGLLYFSHLNDDQKAYDLTTKARDAFAQDADVAKALGVLTYRKGNYARAAQLLRESAQTRTNDAELLYYLGMAQYQMKARPESKATLKRALEYHLPLNLESDAKRVLAELK